MTQIRQTMWIIVVAMASFGSGCAEEGPTPDGAWKVSVEGVTNTCSDSTTPYSESFVYQLYYEGSSTDIDIDGESFASGVVSGCNLTYSSAVWMEERDGGDLQWQIDGEAVVQGAAGGCDTSDDLDWEGTEVLWVVDTEDESIEAGCEYTMTVTGTYVSQ